jgi:hypothetical protein
MRLIPRAATGAALLLALSPARAQAPDGAEPTPAPGDAKPAAKAPDADADEPDEEEDDEGAPPTPAAAAKPPPAPPNAAPGPGPRGAAPAEDGPLAPGWRERLGVALGPLELAPRALLQLQASPYVGEDSLNQAGDVAERPGFRLRRARLGLRGSVQDQVALAISTDLGGDDAGALRLHDAWAGFVAVPAAQLFAGARGVPFSRSAMTGAGDGALIERPLSVRAIAPFTQVGIQLEGHFRSDAFSYYAGAYNGFQRSDQFYAGQSESYAPLGNRFEGVALSGRLAAEPLGPLGRTLQDVSRSPLRIGAGADYFFSNGGARTLQGASGDVLLHASGLHLLGEVLFAQASPRSVPTQPVAQVASISSLALVFEAGYMLVARKLGVSGRFEWIDPDTDVDDEGDNAVITAGVSYHALDDLLKAQLDYTHREELGGLSPANDALTLQLQLSL